MSEEALLLPHYKKGRIKFYEGPHLVAYGDRDRAIFVFKGETAKYQSTNLHHPAVGSHLKFEDDNLVGLTIHMTAFALIKGRGCWVQQYNPTDKNISTIKMWEPIGIGGGAIPTDDLVCIYMRPHEKRWINGWTFLDHILSVHRPRAYRFNDLSHAVPPNEIDEALKAWGREFAPSCCSSQMNLHDIACWIVDGLTETLIPPIKPEKERKQEPLVQIDLSNRITQGSDPDYVLPLDLDRMMNFRSPSMRVLLRRGGAKRFVEACTGTACKSMIKVMAPGLYTIGGVSVALSMVKDYRKHPGFPAMVRDGLMSMRPLMESLSIDHRVKLMELLFKNDGRDLYVDIVRNDSQVKGLMEFFTIAHPTKIIEKCAEAMGISKKMEFLDQWDQHQELPQAEQAWAAAHEGQYIDPFHAMIDAGCQLKRWRKAKLNKKQKKYFPEGIKIKSRWNSIKEIHDDISKQANKLESLGEQVLMPWNELLEKLHGARCGTTRILLPRTNQVLVKWGKAQKHCVGSMYNERMQKGECAIVGVFVSGKLTYCARLAPTYEATLSKDQPVDPYTESNYDRKIIKWELVEFRGEGNCWPKAKDASEVCEIMIESGIDISKWITSNGYGKAKDSTWDDDYMRAALDVGEVAFSELVHNFPQPEEVE